MLIEIIDGDILNTNLVQEAYKFSKKVPMEHKPDYEIKYGICMLYGESGLFKSRTKVEYLYDSKEERDNYFKKLQGEY